jgi:short-subunit dehydrogenase
MAELAKLAVVTGASSGIGLELAKQCIKNGFDVIIASDTAEIQEAAVELRRLGGSVDAVQADLSTKEGVDRLYDAALAKGRPVDVLMANAGRGLGKSFLDQDFGDIGDVIAINVVGTTYLLHRFLRDMRTRNAGKVLVTGSIAGVMPGAFQAVYNATKAYVNSLTFAIRNELKDTDVSLTVLMPGPTDTDFFETADLMDTRVGAGKKQSAADVAKIGFDAMMRGDDHEVAGFGNKLQALAANILPDTALAESHRKLAEPGSARH